MRLSTTLAVAAVIALGGTASAETIRVPKDAGSIQAAVDTARSGDVILIASGTYDENVVIDLKSDLELRGKGKVVINGDVNGSALAILDSDAISISGLRVANSRGGPAIRIANASDIVLTKCQVLRSSAEGIRTDACERIEISRCRIQNTGDDGIGMSVGNGPGPTNNSLITKCVFTNCGDDAVDLHGDDNVISKCKVISTDEDGFEIDSDTGGQRNQFIQCKVSGVPGVGFSINGESNTLIKCSVKKSGDDAFAIRGSFNRLENCKAIAPSFDGFYVPSDDNELIGCVAKKPGDDGFDIEGAGNALQDNVVKKARDNGFEVSGRGNSFARDKASKSGAFDLDDTASGNSYSETRFGNERIADGK